MSPRPDRLRQRWRPRGPGQLILLDLRDSFVYNLAHRLAEVGCAPAVLRAGEVDLDELARWEPRGLILSPGPGHPDEAGCAVEAVAHFAGAIPILGVCLGHQAIASAFGLEVFASGAPRHGQSSPVRHDGQGLFEGLPDPLECARYHSLVARPPGPGHQLVVTAWCGDLLMGLRHRRWPIFGVQFHPESVLSPPRPRAARALRGAARGRAAVTILSLAALTLAVLSLTLPISGISEHWP